MRLEDATVLLVDDEKDLREIFSAWLGRNGCRVLTAANGVEALKVLEMERIDVLVSDIRMPVMGGVELVRNVYQRELPIPSIIFVSSYADAEPREMYGLGVEALIAKPLSRKDLIRALEESLMDREQLWRTPAQVPMVQSLELVVESLLAAMDSCNFQLGRGGCCVSTEVPLEVNKTIDLCIRFTQDRLCLKAQGKVRWYKKDAAQAGVSFDYLEEECRAWVVKMIRDGRSRSFIPQGRPAVYTPATVVQRSYLAPRDQVCAEAT